MASLRAALERLEVSAGEGLRRALPVRPPGGLRELIRVATLPRPHLDDLEPDHPSPFESFEVNDAQGIIHGGGDQWFLSSQFTIRRCEIEGHPFRPSGVRRGDPRGLRELLVEAGLALPLPSLPLLGLPLIFDHIGALGFADPIVYLPVRRKDKNGPHLIMGLSRDLRVVGWGELEMTTGESACAINPWNGLLYVPSRDDTGRLEAYSLAAFAERFGRPSQWGRQLNVARAPPAEHADIQLQTPDGANEGEGMQGVAFSANGRIYVTRSGDEPYHNRIFVYNALTGRRFGAELSWDFPGGDGVEIEGIAVHPLGVLYVSVCDNNEGIFSGEDDDFDLYTFRFRSLDASEV